MHGLSIERVMAIFQLMTVMLVSFRSYNHNHSIIVDMIIVLSRWNHGLGHNGHGSSMPWCRSKLWWRPPVWVIINYWCLLRLLTHFSEDKPDVVPLQISGKDLLKWTANEIMLWELANLWKKEMGVDTLFDTVNSLSVTLASQDKEKRVGLIALTTLRKIFHACIHMGLRGRLTCRSGFSRSYQMVTWLPQSLLQ